MTIKTLARLSARIRFLSNLEFVKQHFPHLFKINLLKITKLKASNRIKNYDHFTSTPVVGQYGPYYMVPLKTAYHFSCKQVLLYLKVLPLWATSKAQVFFWFQVL